MAINIREIVERLKQERDSLSTAIVALERISTDDPKKRGRPRKELNSLSLAADSAQRSGQSVAGQP